MNAPGYILTPSAVSVPEEGGGKDAVIRGFFRPPGGQVNKLRPMAVESARVLGSGKSDATYIARFVNFPGRSGRGKNRLSPRD